MRLMTERGGRRTLAVLLTAVIVASLLAPTAAFAATPKPSIKLSASSLTVGNKVTVSGSMPKSYKGKKVTVQVKKPGATSWSTVKTVKLSKTAKYKVAYTSTKVGTFAFRTRYKGKKTVYSSTKKLAAKADPAPSINLSTSEQDEAAALTISGSMPKSYAGKSVTIQVKKPKSSTWTSVQTAKLSSSGAYSTQFTPQARGVHYFRTRYAGLSTVYSSQALLAVDSVPDPAPSIQLSTTSQTDAAEFTISGSMPAGYAGKTVTVQIRKPGRDYWSSVTPQDVVLDENGAYSVKYTPKLKGTFSLRTLFNGVKPVNSRTVSLTVQNDPGVVNQIRLSSTTSTRDSGLWTVLEPLFLQDCPEYAVLPVWVGSGASISNGGLGDADVVLTHAPSLEVKFMNGIYNNAAMKYMGKTRYKVMYNDYVLVGPTANPAGLAINETATSAFGKVASTESSFFSRNDASGTHTQELAIWKAIGDPQWEAGTTTPKPWYLASGTTGMAAALSAANNNGYYTLSDRATWLNNKATLPNLAILNEKDVLYYNQYSVLELKPNPSFAPATTSQVINWEGGQDLSQWIRSPRAQEAIRTYGEATYGQALFVPNQGSW